MKILPAFYAVTMAINFFSIFYKGSESEYIGKKGKLGLTSLPVTVVVYIIMRNPRFEL